MHMVIHIVSLENAEAMVEGYNKMRNFWNGMSSEERGNYIKRNWLKGTTHKPWQKMTDARLKKIVRRISNGALPTKFIKDRGTKDFVNEWYDFTKKYPKNPNSKQTCDSYKSP